MKIEPRTLKGFRDFLPKDMQKRQYAIDKLRTVFESYGFEPLETPALEYSDILTGKYGDEGEKLMYRFKDLGERDVAMRYDQTVPLARVIAQYKNEIQFPFKRYQVQPVWRADNTQKGRFREFFQFDFDIVGSNTLASDVEILSSAIKSLKVLGFKDFKILINDRGIFKDVPKKAVGIIDKLKKIGEDGVREELKDKGFKPDILENIRTSGQTERIKEILSSSQFSTLNYQLLFDPTLARGLDYYTGLIFEIEVNGYSAGSLGGGGRYDNLIGMFANKSIPAVGGSFGFDRLIEAMEELRLFPDGLSTSNVLVLNLSNLEDRALEIAGKLRDNNINAEVYLDSNVERGKQFSYAEKKGIPYTLEPLEDGSFRLGWKDDGKVNKKTLTPNKVLEHFLK